ATDGFGFFALRHMDQLQVGTVRHLPVPGSELETLNLPTYSFGGATQDPSGLDLAPPMNAGQDLAFSLEAYQHGPWRTLALPNGEMMELPTPQRHAAPGRPTKF
ncbi:MAG: hypothetical protein KGN74_09150, partial [Gemmatimonadota bacterium]|nr:hypothetical protein [Gemmatimonadota bacterium]MDE3173227.1 hypothetical protein [Gemmatimonadota bacterium]